MSVKSLQMAKIKKKKNPFFCPPKSTSDFNRTLGQQDPLMTSSTSLLCPSAPSLPRDGHETNIKPAALLGVTSPSTSCSILCYSVNVVELRADLVAATSKGRAGIL